MSGVLEVVEPGLLTTVQDAGRRDGRVAGVPRGGALDAEALRLVNALAGNAAGAAALEVTHAGPALRASAGEVAVALGACEGARVERRGGGGEPVAAWTVALLGAGDVLVIGRVAAPSLRTCVAVAGGLDVPRVLGSASTDLRSGFGGIAGRPLRRGDRLRTGAAGPRGVALASPVGLGVPGRVRVLPGPERDRAPAAWGALLAATFRVSARSDRTGLRLEGAAVPPADPPEIDSAGCLAGMVQVPAGGEPIVLLADCGTTGGYPRVAVVASVDLPVLGRLRPGASIRFEAVTAAAARAALRAREAELAALERRLRGG